MKTFKQFTERQRLVEEIEKTNDTGFKSTDIADLIEQHESGEWGPAETCEEVLEWVDKIIAECKSK